MNTLKAIRQLALGMILMGGVLSMHAQERPKQVPARKPLVPLAAPATSSAASPLYAFVEMMRIQPDTEQGLQATIVFLNRSEEPVTIFDPRYFTSLTITTEDGAPLLYPDRAGEELTRSDRGDNAVARVITIEPRQDYRVTIAVPEVYPAEPPAPSSDESVVLVAAARPPVPIQAGKYRVGALTAIAAAEQPMVHLRAEPILVRLGGGAE